MLSLVMLESYAYSCILWAGCTGTTGSTGSRIRKWWYFKGKSTSWRRNGYLLLLLSRLSHVWLCANPYTAVHQAPLSLGFSRQEQWSVLPFPSPMHESESEVAQSCLTLSDPMDCSPPGSSIHGIFQARVLEWIAIAFSKMDTCCCCCC